MNEYTMDRISEIKEEIFKNERLAEEGIRIYKDTKDGEFLNNAVMWGNEADKLKRVLKEEYNVMILN